VTNRPPSGPPPRHVNPDSSPEAKAMREIAWVRDLMDERDRLLGEVHRLKGELRDLRAVLRKSKALSWGDPLTEPGGQP
jgi:hypothetical protein